MIILKLFVCLMFFLAIPLIIGIQLSKNTEKNNIFLTYIYGYLGIFASFELIYLIMYFLKCKFIPLVIVWTSIITILSIILLIINLKQLKEMIKTNISYIKKLPLKTIVLILLIFIQIYVPVKYRETKLTDDSFYVGVATTTQETNTLFKYDPYTGELNTKENFRRYAMSGLSIWFATISTLSTIHPAIIMHTIWPIVACLLFTSVCILLGMELFKKDISKSIDFAIISTMVYIFGLVSTHGIFAFYTFKSWMGKGILGFFIIPLIFLLYMKLLNKKDKNWWIIFLLIMISSIFLTEMGVYIVPMESFILSIFCTIKNNDKEIVLKTVYCYSVALIIGIIYVLRLI